MRFSSLLTIMGLFTCFGTYGEEAAKPKPGRRRPFGSVKANRSGRFGRRLWPLVGTVFVLVALIPATSPAATAKPPAGDAKVISDWNQIATSTMAGDTTKTGHPQVFLYMGFVQAAVYDAVVGIDRRYEPYRFHARAPHPSSTQAAAVAAAHEVLVTYFPYAQATLDAAYASSLAEIPDGTAKANGITFGIRTADNLIASAGQRRARRAHLLHPATGPGCLAAHPSRLPVDVRSVARIRDAAARAQRDPVRSAGRRLHSPQPDTPATSPR